MDGRTAYRMERDWLGLANAIGRRGHKVRVNINSTSAPDSFTLLVTRDTLAFAFMALCIAFLAFAAVLFRLKFASQSKLRRFDPATRDELVSELMWQYSLRSNLLLVVVLLSGYLLWLRETRALLLCYLALCLVNVITDTLVEYKVGLWRPVRNCHLAAGVRAL